MSLRMRLTLIILLPLLAIATATGLWQLNNARRTAAEVFDRSLLSAALAVTNDVILSGGDALSNRTRNILNDTSGGLVFYHVYAPDGVIVAGYATPPVGIPRVETEVASPTYFTATYLGQNVIGVRMQTRAQVEGVSGIFTTTVWQDIAVRDAFVQDLVLRSLITITALIAALAIVVWFGVRLGLRPLLDLQDAIGQRSSEELSPIQRPVPDEVRGIVNTLNRLFAQVSRSLTAQSEFISNAAHQLRNPIAGVLSLAEAVNSAPDRKEAQARSEDLLEAARETADLTQKLLTFERAKAFSPESMHQRFDLGAALRDWLPAIQQGKDSCVDVVLGDTSGLGDVVGDPTMLREMISNLVDNSFKHGGPQLSKIEITSERQGDSITLKVTDDGLGIPESDVTAALERFSQLSPTSGAGLGLPIVEAIATSHGGHMQVSPLQQGLEVTVKLKSADGDLGKD